VKPESARFVPKDMASIRGNAISITAGSSVSKYQFTPEQALPLIIEPENGHVVLEEWIKNHVDSINADLQKHGAILFRRFAVTSPDDFEKLALALSGEMAEYTYRSTPRTRVQNRIYTSTEYPPNQTIPMHNENSYASTWPAKIWFYCHQPAEQGGQTPIADSRLVYDRIDPEVRERFARKGVMYVRNYGGGVDLPWQTVFQTQDRGVMESYCRSTGIEWEWLEGERLRTRQVMAAIARHPTTRQFVWFNQAHLFHLTSLGLDVQQSLLATVGEEYLPRHTYHGDGSPIRDEDLDQVRRAYAEAAIEFDWKQGDVLLLDNMLTAHGRRPFRGPRKILVAMAEPIHVKDPEPIQRDHEIWQDPPSVTA
jgi:alpha-ketoglutarate-dependent taurine dioxygenase